MKNQRHYADAFKPHENKARNTGEGDFKDSQCCCIRLESMPRYLGTKIKG